MKRPIIGAALAASCLALAACETTGGLGERVLENLQGCERHYDGAVAGGLTGGQFSGTVKIDCPALTDGTPLKVRPVAPPPGG